MSWEKFQSKLSGRGRNRIAQLNVTNLDQLRGISVEDILAIDGVGRSIANEIHVAAALAGVELASRNPDKRTDRLAATKLLDKIVQRHGVDVVRAALKRYEDARKGS